ncbi:heavy-metal-associated domain-containing protein [uncultured Helcococcus sp.]|uniref:heavy-metal-associated domain-containing protein n=1 Tax=uncultured Helcococcus sp. TaxID=1072508 RepID=UPI00262A239F|nr:heavy-metal-associated domain-containing protein [uncultured Helcococcus sp.]
MKKLNMQLETLTCPSCLEKIEKGVKSLEGVDKDSVKVLFNSAKVKLNFDENVLDSKEVENKIRSLGYDVLSIKIS